MINECLFTSRKVTHQQAIEKDFFLEGEIQSLALNIVHTASFGRKTRVNEQRALKKWQLTSYL